MPGGLVGRKWGAGERLLIDVIPEVVIGDPDSYKLPGCPITTLGHDGWAQIATLRFTPH